MTTIYAVSCGEYSDYGIEAMFSTKELAQKYVDACDGAGDEREIEEYELDADVPTARHGWFVRIDPDGTVLECGRIGRVGPARYDAVDRNGRLFTTMWADDEAHAVKIANERRTAAILDGRLKAAPNPEGP